ncbi:MAG: hypothetical protein HWE39_13620 [Oceanospirillaceae bacterium]|nr:hypothetical protein [Oceanospirillaceae bacterium]
MKAKLPLPAWLCVPLLLSADLQADTAQPWQFRASVYGYFPSLDGQTRMPVADDGSEIGIDASDYLDALEFAFMASLEAQKGQWGLLTDYIYLDFQADKSNTRELSFSGPAGNISLPASVTADADMGLTGWNWLLAATYAAVDKEDDRLQLLGGLRAINLEASIDWELAGALGALPAATRSGSSTEESTWWNTVVGARGETRLGASQWYVPYYADIGSGEADFTWQAMIGLGHRFEWGQVTAMYRHLEYDFGDDFIEELSFSGPAIAATFLW